jgi:hypothetical protein
MGSSSTESPALPLRTRITATASMRTMVRLLAVLAAAVLLALVFQRRLL